MRYVTLLKYQYSNVTNGDIMASEELDSKIFLITFNKPMYVMKIGEIIYGEKRATYPKLMGKDGAIKRCEKKKWIKKIDVGPPEEKPLGFERRDYYITNIDLFIDTFINKINLEDEEKKEIIRIIKSDTFKKSVSDFTVLIDFPNNAINAFELLNDLIGYLCAYIYMSKNYGNFFNEKITKLFPSKKHIPNLYDMGKKDLNNLQRKIEKKGFDRKQFLNEYGIMYNELLPESNISNVLKDKLVDHYVNLIKEFYVLDKKTIEKLIKLIPIHKYTFLNFIAGGFIFAEKSNQTIIQKLIHMIKPKKGFRKKVS